MCVYHIVRFTVQTLACVPGVTIPLDVLSTVTKRFL
jgi:hypothetical protein